MSSSPYLSQDLKDYMRDFKIEETLSKTVNQLLRGKYSDPYAFLMNEFGKLAKNDITILSVTPYQVINANSLPSIKFGQPSESVLPLYDNVNEVDGGKGVKNAMELIQTKIKDIVSKRSTKDQKQIDEQLLQFYEANQNKGINAIQTISYSLSQITSQIEKRQQYEIFQQITGNEGESINKPKIMINLLQGSKLVGVKCKVYKFLLIVDKYDNAQQLLDIVSSITGNIRKTITSGKLGEAGLKYHTDGTFIVTVDTINDNLKMIEEAINKTPYKDNVYVGLNLMADNLYLPDKKLYELENPKQLMDPTQLADFLLKLCTDKPIIRYIQDPIKNDDLEGWSKFMSKFSGKNILIASSFLYSTINRIKQTSIPIDADSNPEMSEADRNLANSKKFDINCAHYRPFEFPTLTSFLDVAKQCTNKKNSSVVIIQDNNEEFTDTTIVDLAFALKNCWLNLVSPYKLERLLKYNRIIEIFELEKIKNKSAPNSSVNLQ